MEKYQVISTNDDNVSIKEGVYFNKIQNKHIEAYGEFGAANIRDNIVSTFSEAINQVNNKFCNNNVLLIGKVQSGKTSNLELFTALALDNGYNLVVIYGGYV